MSQREQAVPSGPGESNKTSCEGPQSLVMGWDDKDMLQNEHDTPVEQGESKNKHIYIGETSRVWRARVAEHYKNAENLKPDSFMVQHWARAHFLSDERPVFKFKIVRNCQEALSRQISEAVWIDDVGNLNSKAEFGMNHICKLISEVPQWESESQFRRLEGEKRRLKLETEQFIKRLKLVTENARTDKNNKFFRSLKRLPALDDPIVHSKKQRMESSTPLSTRDVRHNNLIPSPTSPVAPCDLSDQPSDAEYIGPSSTTGASWDLDHCNMTPTKRGETSTDIEIGANALLDAAEMSGAFNNASDAMAGMQQEDQQLIQEQLEGLDLNDWSSNLSRASTEPPISTTPPAGADLATPPNAEVLVSAHNDAEDTPAPTDEELVSDAENEGPVSAPCDDAISNMNVNIGNENNNALLSTPANKQLSPFGNNIPTELAKLRATPNATPVKRKLIFPTNESSKKKKKIPVSGGETFWSQGEKKLHLHSESNSTLKRKKKTQLSTSRGPENHS